MVGDGSLKLNRVTDEVRHSLQVTSFGGAGTTVLLRHFAELGFPLPAPDNDWGRFKHQRRPPAGVEVPTGFRVLYPWADPRISALSLLRRRLRKSKRTFAWAHWGRMDLAIPAPPDDIAEALDSVEAFVELERDPFDIADHLRRWLLVKDYPVIFASYVHLPFIWSDVMRHLALPIDTPLFSWKGRESALEKQAPHVIMRLTQIYSEALHILRELPPVLSNQDIITGQACRTVRDS